MKTQNFLEVFFFSINLPICAICICAVMAAAIKGSARPRPPVFATLVTSQTPDPGLIQHACPLPAAFQFRQIQNGRHDGRHRRRLCRCAFWRLHHLATWCWTQRCHENLGPIHHGLCGHIRLVHVDRLRHQIRHRLPGQPTGHASCQQAEVEEHVRL